jgi:hypothetical protein
VHRGDAPLPVAELFQDREVDVPHLLALLAAAQNPERLRAGVCHVEERSAGGVGDQLAALAAVAVDQPVEHRPPQPAVDLGVPPPAAAGQAPGVGFVKRLLDVVGRAVLELACNLADELVAQSPTRDPIQGVARRRRGTVFDDQLPHYLYTRRR